jgi:hypothetical protein
MKKLLPVLLVLVLALPSIASAVEPSGTLVHVPESGADSGGPTPKSWLFPDIFYVRLHTCRTTSFIICGPDPLISSGFSFNSYTRIWVPFTDSYTVYTFVLDSEGNVVAFSFGTFTFAGGSYNNLWGTFTLSDGLYKLLGLAIGNGSGRITFSNYYQFRVGGPGSSGCCP